MSIIGPGRRAVATILLGIRSFNDRRGRGHERPIISANVSLKAGSRLGPFEIVAPLGAGGMGEVYRARDERLKRDVAIKVLPASFSTDHDRLRRFEQEAQAAGTLNHPNITAVYDIGEHDGAPYVVQELLEGQTLRAELAGGRFSPRHAIEYAQQIAHGLAAAHEKGIVHRDLKPENVFVTKDGRVKILDFGLAKLTQPEKAGPQTSLPTETAGTEPGVVLGTLGYMSPEQVRGKPADARSDIFAFGAILYEMLSGKRAFHGDSAADTMSTILREDPPDLSSTNRLIAPALDRIVRHCLEKNPEARFHSAHDLAFDLEALSGAEVPGAPVAVAPPTRRLKLVAFLVGVAVVGLLLAAALAIFAGLRSRREPAGNLVRFSVPVPPGTTYAPGEVSRGVSISPDGTRLVIEALSGGRRHLFVRPLDSDQTTELEGTAETEKDPGRGRSRGGYLRRRLRGGRDVEPRWHDSVRRDLSHGHLSRLGQRRERNPRHHSVQSRAGASLAPLSSGRPAVPVPGIDGGSQRARGVRFLARFERASCRGADSLPIRVRAAR